MFDAEDFDHDGCHVGVTLLLGFQGSKNRHLQYTFKDFQNLLGPKVSKTLLKMETKNERIQDKSQFPVDDFQVPW